MTKKLLQFVDLKQETPLKTLNKHTSKQTHNHKKDAHNTSQRNHKQGHS